MKSILITGCSSGIGLTSALGLYKRGHRVFATARKQEDVKKLQQFGLESLQLDINDSCSIQEVIGEIKSRTGSCLEVLINNCSYAQPGAVEDLTRDAIRSQFETNLFGPLELTIGILRLMRQQGYGRIIQIGSLLGYVTMPYRSAYSASKFALEGLSDTLRQELRGVPITVSLIEPGPIRTQIRENAKIYFDRYIQKQGSIHQQVYERMETSFFKEPLEKSFYLSPEAVLSKLVHAVEDKKPRARYYVGFPSYFFMILKRFLPTYYLDWIIERIIKKEIN